MSLLYTMAAFEINDEELSAQFDYWIYRNPSISMVKNCGAQKSSQESQSR